MEPEYVAKAQTLLARDTKQVPDFWLKKYRQEASKNWDKFYKRNQTRFFKDRHWVQREFEELQRSGQQVKLLEVGCGVGNFAFPLLEANPELFIYACDFSTRAVDLVKANPLYTTDRCRAFVCDLTQDDLPGLVCQADLEAGSATATVDIISMIFVLSAVPPEKMAAALRNIYNALRPGGRVLFRDYGLYDAAQLRFKPGCKLEDNFYVRQDGTMAFYFSTERTEVLFKEAGFGTVSLEYVFRKTTNVKEGLDVDRVFVQAKFEKPVNTLSAEE
ncbi:hypothetical protein IWQ60_006701 [Tieghemiomyces parasiticus]|uniref:tRNA N(3)-methylcytidine methyltransferase n=1 Tax=Tieghemiomyces parasiticus TaxID=78921 RepID=A0A9W8DSZ1_9FUNG|nr:hypothetical protein IWQ60_006701 [Tieghemiomyces parasiticus]